MSKKYNAFSLVEILITLIIVSLITAALAPVITKKLSSSGVTIIGGSSSNEIPNESIEVEKCEKEIPEYTYKTSSGTNVTTNTSYIKIESDSTYWKIKFLKSGVFELKNADFTIDAFAVGGGAGGGNYGGGGGGYTVTIKSIATKKEVAYAITVGDGGAAKTNGNASYITKKSDGTKLINASGGKYSSSGGGDGGSGGAGGGSGNCKAGAAGYNGGDGKKLLAAALVYTLEEKDKVPLQESSGFQQELFMLVAEEVAPEMPAEVLLAEVTLLEVLAVAVVAVRILEQMAVMVAQIQVAEAVMVAVIIVNLVKVALA